MLKKLQKNKKIYIFKVTAQQMSYCPVIWWRRESDWEEWEVVLFSLDLQPLWFYEMFQWAQTTHWTHSLRLSLLRSLIQTSFCLSSKVSPIFWTYLYLKYNQCLYFSYSSVSVSSPEIPNADLLLHADCNEQEVTCEISRYSPRGCQESSDLAYFMVSLSVEELDFSTSLILQTQSVERTQSTLVQNKLGLPLSQSGTLQTKGKTTIRHKGFLKVKYH